MKKEEIERHIREKRIVQRSMDIEKANSLLDSAKLNAEVALAIKLNDKTSTVIFREIYESIRQLGDSLWWFEGFSPQDHDISLEIIKHINIKNNFKLNYLDRFRKIRHDANYRGYKVTESQAIEIISFWSEVGKEIIEHIESILKK